MSNSATAAHKTEKPRGYRSNSVPQTKKLSDLTVAEFIEVQRNLYGTVDGVYIIDKDTPPDKWPDVGYIHIGQLKMLGMEEKRIFKWEERYNLERVKNNGPKDCLYRIADIKAILLDRYKRDNKKEVA